MELCPSIGNPVGSGVGLELFIITNWNPVPVLPVSSGGVANSATAPSVTLEVCCGIYCCASWTGVESVVKCSTPTKLPISGILGDTFWVCNCCCNCSSNVEQESILARRWFIPSCTWRNFELRIISRFHLMRWFTDSLQFSWELVG